VQRQLFDLWETPAEQLKAWEMPWKVQLVGHVGQFQTKEAAERYVNLVKEYREKSARLQANTQANRKDTSDTRSGKAPSKK
jgi:hypothetical protein